MRLNLSDYDHDGYTDIMLGGNFIQSKPEVGTYNASFGTLFKGSADGSLHFVPNAKAGFRIDGAVRDIEDIRIDDNNVLIFTRNGNTIYTIDYARQK